MVSKIRKGFIRLPNPAAPPSTASKLYRRVPSEGSRCDSDKWTDRRFGRTAL